VPGVAFAMDRRSRDYLPCLLVSCAKGGAEGYESHVLGTIDRTDLKIKKSSASSVGPTCLNKQLEW
jgi:hypothetical protein